ncbi:MAG TPA: MFS transporter [Rectinemataceae bacterium]|nr:MFS transporter [Rectinemataceae bacterium]
MSKKPLLSPLLRIFLFAMILANIGGQMFYPLQALYLKQLGADVEQIGLFFTLLMIVPIATQIFGGWVSDRIGRLRAMAIGSLIGVIGNVAVLLSPDWKWLLAAESLSAITGAFVAPSFDAFIAEQSDEENRGKVFATSQAIFQIVSVVGPLAGGFAVKSYGFFFVLLVSAILYVIATIIRVALALSHPRTRHPDAPPEQGLGATLKTIGLMALGGGFVTWLIISDGARDIAMGFSGSLMPLFLQEVKALDPAGIGSLESLFGLTMMLMMIPAGHFSDRFGERKAIALGYFGAFLAFMTLLLIPGKTAAFLSYGAFGMAIGLLTPAYQSLVSKAFPDNLRGTAFGLLSTSNGILSLPAPYLGGLMWKAWGPTSPFLITAFAMLIIIIPVWLKFRLPQAPLSRAAP